MGIFTRPPYALFDLEGLPVKTLDTILTIAKDGSTLEAFLLYLPGSSSYDDAPHRLPKGQGQDGTHAPLPKDFSSPFKEQSLENVKDWLRNKPEDVDLEGKFFAVLDKKAKEDTPLVALCRIGDKEGEGEEVHCVLVTAEESTLTLAGLDYGKFDTLIDGKGEYTPEV